MLTRAHESMVFGLKSTENHARIAALRFWASWGGRGRTFKSCHSDQNRRFNRTSDFLLFSLVFSQMLVFSWFCVCLYLSILGAFFIAFLGPTTCLTTIGFWGKNRVIFQIIKWQGFVSLPLFYSSSTSSSYERTTSGVISVNGTKSRIAPQHSGKAEGVHQYHKTNRNMYSKHRGLFSRLHRSELVFDNPLLQYVIRLLLQAPARSPPSVP